MFGPQSRLGNESPGDFLCLSCSACCHFQADVLFCPSEHALVYLSFILSIASSNVFIPREILVVSPPIFMDRFYRMLVFNSSYISSCHFVQSYFLRLLSSLSCTSPIPSSQLPHSARSVYGRISSLMLSLVLLVQLFILLSSVEHCFYVNLCRVYPYVRCYWLLFVLAFWSFVCQFVTVRVNGHLDVACHSPNNMFNL